MGHLSSLFYHPEKHTNIANVNDHQSQITILIPAYKVNDRFPQRLKNLRASLDGLPHTIYVLFQHCEKTIIDESVPFCHHFDKATFNHLEGNPYHHALRYALDQIKNHHPESTHILVLDPDNIIENKAYSKFLAYTETDADVIQGQRMPDTTSGSTSQFDAISERLNDIQFRRSKVVQHLYIELAGSGMMLRYNLFKEAVENLDTDAPGMDKNLLIQLIRIDPFIKMHYDERITIVDEKTSQPDQLHRQRLRWFANQYFNAFRYAYPLIKLSITHRILAPADYAITLARPPRSVQFLLAILLPVTELVLLFFDIISIPYLTIAMLPFIAGTAIFVVSNPDVISPSKIPGLIYLALKNSLSALLSLHPKLKGTFISTRNK